MNNPTHPFSSVLNGALGLFDQVAAGWNKIFSRHATRLSRLELGGRPIAVYQVLHGDVSTIAAKLGKTLPQISFTGDEIREFRTRHRRWLSDFGTAFITERHGRLCVSIVYPEHAVTGRDEDEQSITEARWNRSSYPTELNPRLVVRL